MCLCVIFLAFVLRLHSFPVLLIVVVADTFLMGITLLCLGFMALYMGSIHGEVINRPLYIIKGTLNFD